MAEDYEKLSVKQLKDRMMDIDISTSKGMTELRGYITVAQTLNKEDGDRVYNEIWSKLKKATRKEKDDLKKTLVNILAQIIYDNIIETKDYE